MHFARIGAAMRWHCNPRYFNALCPKPDYINIVAALGSHFQCCTQFAPKKAIAMALGWPKTFPRLSFSTITSRRMWEPAIDSAFDYRRLIDSR